MLSHLSKQILYHIYISEKPLSTQSLSIECGASINTIRKEIILLNAEIKSKGCYIQSRQASGCQLVILDKQKAEAFFKRMKFNKKMHSHLRLMENYRSFYIIRLLLVSSDYVPMQKLCDALHCSRSTVTREIRYARSYLKTYELSIQDKKLQGLYIEGNEWNRRLCLIEQHKLFCQMDHHEQNQEQKFQRHLMISSTSYSIFLKRITNVLSKYHDIRFPFMNIPKIIIYMILCINRQKFSSNMHFTQQQRVLAKHNRTYPLAKEFFFEIKKSGPYTFCEEDILSLAMLLCTYQTPIYQALTCEASFPQLSSCAKTVLNDIQYRYQNILLQTQDINEEFLCQLQALYFQREFQVSIDEESCKLIEYEGLLAVDLCIELAKSFKQHFHITLHSNQALQFYYLFNRSLMRSVSNSHTYRMLIISQFGISYAKNVRDRLQKAYPRFIKAMDVEEFNFNQSIDANAYDLILTDIHLDEVQRNIAIPYTIPFLEIDFTQNFTKQPQLRHFFSHIHQEEALRFLNHHIHFTYASSVTELALLAANDWSEGTLCDEIVNSILKRMHYMNNVKKNNIVLLTPMDTFSIPSSLHIFINQKAIHVNHHECNIFILYYIHPNAEKELKLIHYILSKFFDLHMDQMLQLSACTSYQDCLKLLNL